jgi:hypothetical protein
MRVFPLRGRLHRASSGVVDIDQMQGARGIPPHVRDSRDASIWMQRTEKKPLIFQAVQAEICPLRQFGATRKLCPSSKSDASAMLMDPLPSRPEPAAIFEITWA